MTRKPNPLSPATWMLPNHRPEPGGCVAEVPKTVKDACAYFHGNKDPAPTRVEPEELDR